MLREIGENQWKKRLRRKRTYRKGNGYKIRKKRKKEIGCKSEAGVKSI